MSRRKLWGLGFVVSPVMAAEPVRPALANASGVDILQWSLGLLAVLAMLMVFAWLLRRMGGFSRLEPGRFQVLAALSLGARERVVLVQVGDKQLVLGVAPGRVQTLCELKDMEKLGTQGSPLTGESFAERLAQLLPGKHS